MGCKEHRVPGARDPGDTGAWTHGVQGDLCTGALGHPVSWPQEAADMQCSGHRESWAGGVTPPCLPWQGPAWPTPVLGSPPACPPRVVVAGGWQCPAARASCGVPRVCAHVLAAELVALAPLPDSDICLQPFPLAVTHQVLAVEERGGGRGVGGTRHCRRPRTTDCLPQASAVLWPSNARVEVTAMRW